MSYIHAPDGVTHNGSRIRVLSVAECVAMIRAYRAGGITKRECVEKYNIAMRQVQKILECVVPGVPAPTEWGGPIPLKWRLDHLQGIQESRGRVHGGHL
jgi:hypothetical protein